MSDRVKTYEQLLDEYQVERNDPSFEPIRLGFGTIDAELRGVSPGQVAVIAARTGVGKTWLLEAIESNVAETGVGICVMSLEMPGLEWAERAVAISEGVAPEQVEAWAKQGELQERTADFLAKMANVRVVENVGPNEMLPTLEAVRESLPVPLRLLLIDYFGLLDTSGRDAYERVSKAAIGLKKLAKQEHVSIVVASQLSRAGGNGSEPVSLEMLRDSGVVEESADFIIGAWRPEKQRDISPDDYFKTKNVLRLAILKNRKGGEGRDIALRFEPGSGGVYEDADPFAELA